MKIIKVTLNELELVSHLFDLYRQFYDQKSDLNSAKKFLSNRIMNNESEIFLAVEENINSGMGFVQLYPSFSSVGMKRLWILNDLYVDSEYRKKGVAQKLIERAVELAHQTNASTIILETQTSNTDAQKLYEKIGFRKNNEHYYYILDV